MVSCDAEDSGSRRRKSGFVRRRRLSAPSRPGRALRPACVRSEVRVAPYPAHETRRRRALLSLSRGDWIAVLNFAPAAWCDGADPHFRFEAIGGSSAPPLDVFIRQGPTSGQPETPLQGERPSNFLKIFALNTTN